MAGILGFNLGIETMQLIVVAVTMPSLVIRIGGALFAGFAAVGWIAKRWLYEHNPVDVMVENLLHRAV